VIYLYISIGGVCGALARFALGSWIAGAAGSAFPWGTLAINVSGSILLGFLLSSFPAWGTPPDLRALFTVGFCGAFTTFSTFAYETVALGQRGAYGVAVTYAVASLVLGVAGVLLGMGLAVAAR
jgi:CrcB protein